VAIGLSELLRSGGLQADGEFPSNFTPKSAILSECLIATCWAVR